MLCLGFQTHTEPHQVWLILGCLGFLKFMIQLDHLQLPFSVIPRWYHPHQRNQKEQQLQRLFKMIQTFQKKTTTNTCHFTDRPTPRNPPSKTIQPSTPLGLLEPPTYRQRGHRSGVHVAVRRLGSYGLPSFRWNRGPLGSVCWFGFLLCGFLKGRFFWGVLFLG